MSANREFNLSRIYAQGWRAAGRLSEAQTAMLEDKGAAALNPYTDKEDRARWQDGFETARGATGTLPFRPATGFKTAEPH